ncbi:hypothetical protein OPT61_g10754 [Boeremia exigua]|uniref:Uncharacterized protein n=1 Tax=Boeremia exigua TaxID=749465 RepID=A0ACC2HN44_9PLEO|nr:hypothetical protein OPT61_g10754 [Boeremia exigua]
MVGPDQLRRVMHEHFLCLFSSDVVQKTAAPLACGATPTSGVHARSTSTTPRSLTPLRRRYKSSKHTSRIPTSSLTLLYRSPRRVTRKRCRSFPVLCCLALVCFTTKLSLTLGGHQAIIPRDYSLRLYTVDLPSPLSTSQTHPPTTTRSLPAPWQPTLTAHTASKASPHPSKSGPPSPSAKSKHCGKSTAPQAPPPTPPKPKPTPPNPPPSRASSPPQMPAPQAPPPPPAAPAPPAAQAQA